MDEIVIARFEAKVDRSGGLHACHPWKGSLTGAGYGQMVSATPGLPRLVLTHRVAFFVAHGRWPDPCCCHRCDNRPCCNPAHLWEGSRQQNTADMNAKGRHGECRGESNGRALLTAEQVADIRSLRGAKTRADIAALYGVSPSAVGAIHLGANWAHLRE